MAENRHLDDFIESLDTSKMNLNTTEKNTESMEDKNMNFMDMDDLMKQKILKKAYRKLRRNRTLIKYAAAACIILTVLSSFIPNTPAYALRQTILSYIPGVGVVENTGESDIVTSVLAEPVKVTDGDKFVEIRTAFTKGNLLTISGITNVGAVDAKNFENVQEFKEFFSGETAPLIYLIRDNERTKDRHQTWAGPSYETRVYKMNAYFYLNEDKPADTYLFEMDDFDKSIEITLSQVKSGVMPEQIGNAAVIDDVILFAHAMHEGDIVEVLVSIVAPSEYKHPRSYLFNHEKELFASGVYLTDRNGTRYEPDEDLRKSRDDEIHTFYFHVPEDRAGLKLVVPQILFGMDYKEDNIKITMPKESKETQINQRVQLGKHSISLDRASMIPAGNEILPDDFKPFGSLMITTSAATEKSSRESILRIIPDIEAADSLFDTKMVSQSIYTDFWNPGQHGGYSLIHFDNMKETKKIIINFAAEISMTGPWEIKLDKDK